MKVRMVPVGAPGRLCGRNLEVVRHASAWVNDDHIRISLLSSYRLEQVRNHFEPMQMDVGALKAVMMVSRHVRLVCLESTRRGWELADELETALLQSSIPTSLVVGQGVPLLQFWHLGSKFFGHGYVDLVPNLDSKPISRPNGNHRTEYTQSITHLGRILRAIAPCACAVAGVYASFCILDDIVLDCEDHLHLDIWLLLRFGNVLSTHRVC
mmetsp:Transcript_7872/g.18388  ORF Transcript_7872/g.18388 Transcript_7872/m.18388 type:complete len:211 (-) Transcript_7872:344-976(-)